MANRERGEFRLTVGGRTYTARLTTNAMAELEDVTNGRTWDQVMTGLLVRGSVKDLRHFLWAALRDQHPDVATMTPDSLRTIGGLIDEAGGMAGVIDQVRAFMALNDEPDEEGAPPAHPPLGAVPAGVGVASISTPELPGSRPRRSGPAH